MAEADYCVRNLKSILSIVESISVGSSKGESKKWLLDPKYLVVDSFDCTKPGDFVGLRDT